MDRWALFAMAAVCGFSLGVAIIALLTAQEATRWEPPPQATCPRVACVEGIEWCEGK